MIIDYRLSMPIMSMVDSVVTATVTLVEFVGLWPVANVVIVMIMIMFKARVVAQEGGG